MNLNSHVKHTKEIHPCHQGYVLLIIYLSNVPLLYLLYFMFLFYSLSMLFPCVLTVRLLTTTKKTLHILTVKNACDLKQHKLNKYYLLCPC